jgi:hypothetical protein
MKDGRESITRRHPILLFGIPGMLMLVAGLIWGVMVVNRVLQIHATPIGNALISVSLCIGGTMAIYASIILNTIGRLELEVRDRGNRGDGYQASPQVSSARSSTGMLVLFALLGGAALLAGLAVGAWAVYVQYTRGSLLYGTYIVSVSLCIAGLMTILSGAILQALHAIMARVQATGVVEQHTSPQAALGQPVVTHL